MVLNYRQILFRLALILLLLYPGCSLNVKAGTDIYIRLSQVGFLTGEMKSAVIIASTDLTGSQFVVKSSQNGKTEFTGKLNTGSADWGSFKYCYTADFTSLRKTGEYYLELNGNTSYSFVIGDKAFDGIAAKLLEFFKVQRCGYTNPLLHDVCHIADAKELIEKGRRINKAADVTGGWHDAGDYIKFLNTISYSTYMLLFSYEFDPVKFGFDNDKNGVPDVLDEAKIGLDWMLRSRYGKDKFITQVQELKDHDVGWRMPEADPLGFDRPAFVGSGKNLIGMYCAAMSLASRIWTDKIQYPEFAGKCLSSAEELYSLRNTVPDVDSSGSGMYIDKNFKGKLALGAIELYISTQKAQYLKDAGTYADSAGADYWWSWGDINSLADYKIAAFIPRFADYIKLNLDRFNETKSGKLFGTPVDFLWGSNNTLLGVTLQTILYKKLTGSTSYDSLGIYQRDYILGRNPWGVSFIGEVGKNYTRNFHHQIAYLKGRLPGGFSAGPASGSYLEKFKIPYAQSDQYARFQTDNAIYRDDRMDYITNEPTITANATAIFVYGYYLNSK